MFQTCFDSVYSPLPLLSDKLTMVIAVAFFVGFLRNESGATAIEYGLIAGLISVVVLTVITKIGRNINTKFNNIANALN